MDLNELLASNNMIMITDKRGTFIETSNGEEFMLEIAYDEESDEQIFMFSNEDGSFFGISNSITAVVLAIAAAN